MSKCGLVVCDESIVNFRNIIESFIQRYIYNEKTGHVGGLSEKSKSHHISMQNNGVGIDFSDGTMDGSKNLDGHFLVGQLELVRNFLSHILKSCLQTCISAKIFQPFASAIIPAIQQCLNILIGLIRDLSFEGYERLTPEEQGTWLVSAIFFSCIWAFGGRLDYSRRVVFDKYARVIFQMKSIMKVVQSWNLKSAVSVSQLIIPFPDDGLVFDYFFSDTLLRWMTWDEMDSNNPLFANLKGMDLVFDSDSVRFSYLIGLLLLKERVGKGEAGLNNVRKLSRSMVPIMIEGPAGVGKTSILRKALNFCFQDNPNVTISTIIANPYLETEVFSNQIRRNTIQRGFNRIGPEAKNSLFLLIEDLDEVKL